MKSTRFLLPFTQGIDLGALEYAVQFARSCQAKLIPLALIPLSEQQWAKGPRLEAIEQANDFLEAVKYKAERAGVVVEPCEMGTRDVVHSLNVFAQEMMCEGILQETEPTLADQEPGDVCGGSRQCDYHYRVCALALYGALRDLHARSAHRR